MLVATRASTLCDGGFFNYRGRGAGLLIAPAFVFWALSGAGVPAAAGPGELFNAGGWLLLGAGMFVRSWATLYVGGQKSQTLAVDGPYAACRHPLYFGSALVSLALVCFTSSPVVASAVVAALLLHGLIVVPSEERHLRRVFGQAYHEYQRATPRFLPRLARLRRPGRREVKIAACLRESGRNIGLIAIASAVECVARLRMEAWWPHWFDAW